jgi:hypothetical protein
MGNKTSNSVNAKENNKTLPVAAVPTKTSFDFLYVIGKGGFGKVLSY